MRKPHIGSIVPVELPFQDRAEAGRLLGAELVARKPGANTAVIALARGGLPIGAEVARALNAPLDVIVVRKLGVPWQPELAMGAIAGSTRVLDRRVIRELRVSDEQVEAVIARETEEMERREKLYRRGLAPLDPAGRTVILVDDGLATGSTMVAAARHIRSAHPAKLIVAVPLGTPEACSRLRKEADECLCLALPRLFFSVGQWYTDFRQVSDAQVQAILRRSNTRVESAR
ncbi:MAG TPA: phosphoribosyltransferase family protein [Bryobacteraceae bacterium]|nr:phosphoribosyltransferase family protein [Bryobacteraceae bacterium]